MGHLLWRCPASLISCNSWRLAEARMRSRWPCWPVFQKRCPDDRQTHCCLYSYNRQWALHVRERQLAATRKGHSKGDEGNTEWPHDDRCAHRGSLGRTHGSGHPPFSRPGLLLQCLPHQPPSACHQGEPSKAKKHLLEILLVLTVHRSGHQAWWHIRAIWP